jgi:probable F420-dependent oxidoreductase
VNVQLGVVFPQTEIGSDFGAIRAYAEGVQELGFEHLLAYDHVVGADRQVHAGWRAPYDVHTTFHEPLVLFGFLAACTTLELVTGIIILPQRQTVLVAKQAAEIDLMTRGRLRVGVGIGWNSVEYEALGKDFADRGQRLTEQVSLLRRLWSEQSVTFAGAFERVTGAGLSPLPIQRPIPIWFGADSPSAFRRAGQLADGWIPQMQPGADLDAALAEIGRSARAVGRDPAVIGMQGRVSWDGRAEDIARMVAEWRGAGATHVAINTMDAGLATVDAHVQALKECAELLAASP